MTVSDEPQFLRFHAGRKVHVFAELAVFDVDIIGWRALRDGDEMGTWIMAHQRALCGQVAPSPGLFGLDHFADNDLCRACAARWPHDSNLLFEHPIDEPADVGE